MGTIATEPEIRCCPVIVTQEIIDKSLANYQRLAAHKHIYDAGKGDVMLLYVEAFTGYSPGDVLRIIKGFEVLRQASQCDVDGRLPHEVRP